MNEGTTGRLYMGDQSWQVTVESIRVWWWWPFRHRYVGVWTVNRRDGSYTTGRTRACSTFHEALDRAKTKALAAMGRDWRDQAWRDFDPTVTA